MEKLNKEIIKQRFSKSITSYNEEAIVQKKIAKELIEKVVNNHQIKYRNVLEIGCGTGFLTYELLRHLQPKHFYINDLVDIMENEIEKVASKFLYSKYSFISGDAEKIHFPVEIDLVISSSAIQWFNNPALFFKSISKSVKSNGYIGFSTFGEKNFKEINVLLQHGLNYPSAEKIRTWLEPFFDNIEIEEKTTVLHFNTPKDVLKHIKDTGVNGIGNISLNKEKLERFESDYLKLFSKADKKVSLTYNPILVLARKKNG